MAAQRIHSSTQKFTEILDFVDTVVVFTGGNAAMIIEITASNFSLLSRREQDSRIFSYAGMLNSLSFPIQLLIRNKRMDITSYLKDLDDVIHNTKNKQLATYISYYRTFVHEMVTINVVLNKSFYIIIPFSSLEAGIQGASLPTRKGQSKAESLAEAAAKILQTKAGSLLAQLQKFAVTAKILEKDELIKLFYDIYNEGATLDIKQFGDNIDAPIITGGTNQ